MKTLLLGVALGLLILDKVHAQTASLSVQFVTELNSSRTDNSQAGRSLPNVVGVVQCSARHLRTAIDKRLPVQHVITMVGEQRFEPTLVIARKGDTLRFTQVGLGNNHPSVRLLNNRGNAPLIELKESEHRPVPFDCDVHPWMRGTLFVLEDQFAGQIGVDGILRLGNLPPNCDATLAAYMNGQPLQLRHSSIKRDQSAARFIKFRTSAGHLDLGEMVGRMPAGPKGKSN